MSSFLVEGGVPDQILKLSGTTFIVCTCEEIISEADRILKTERIRKRYEYDDEELQNFLLEFRGSSSMIKELPRVEVVKDDPKDNMIFACAVKADAKYIVSGDHHVLSVKIYQNIIVHSPREFLNLIQASKTGSETVS